jgi:hypothetical protein
MAKNLTIVLIAVAVAMMPMGAAWARHPDTGPGCGLGKLVWGDYKHQHSIAPQVLMATTNDTFGSQTFGISTGTSGCTNDGTILAQYKAPIFAEATFESLSQEMAQGGGEHLASLATLLGVPPDHQAEFFVLAQERYTILMQSGDISSVALLKALNDAMESHPILAKLSTKP